MIKKLRKARKTKSGKTLMVGILRTGKYFRKNGKKIKITDADLDAYSASLRNPKI